MVEQRTHKPLVAGSIPAPGTKLSFVVTTVYILRGASGRHYIGLTDDLPARIEQHRRGHTHTTSRLGGSLELVVSREYPDRETAAAIERRLKSWKSPQKAIAFLAGFDS